LLVGDAEAWVAADPDPATRAELAALVERHDIEALRERMGPSLEFGTAGLRGLLGAGRSRMNRAVVIRTTAGLASYLIDTVPDVKSRGVVVGRDGRRGSADFLEDTTAVLAGAGIPVHVLEFPTSTPGDPASGVVPTPLVSYAVIALKAAAGVMITASHNPPEYNGYKVYWSDGAQIIPPHDKAIATAIERVGAASDVDVLDKKKATAAGLRRVADRALLDGYYAAIAANAHDVPNRNTLVVAYTPLHGVGNRFVHELFDKLGYTALHSVIDQAAPDGAFPTVRFPNPEEPGALDRVVGLAKERRADLVLANDPDADRLAVAVPDGRGTYRALTGNEIGVLLAHYLLTEAIPSGDRLVMTTIVSSPLLGVMANKLGVRYDETLTGFKWIGTRAQQIERETGTRFVMGYEEALGYTIGTVARDKDGIGAAALFAELCAHGRSKGETVVARLERIYREHGLVMSRQHNVTKAGVDGAGLIAREMSGVRAAPPAAIANEKVLAIRDYKERVRIDRATGTKTPLTLPASNVLAFELEGGEGTIGTRVTMRPSGTEPKIKYYFDVVEPLRGDEPLSAAQARATARLDALEAAFVAFAARASGTG
jgi:phosphomannomutase